MQIVSRILIVIGLLITGAGALATRYAVNYFVNALEVSGAGGIGAVARGIEMTYTYNTVSLLGCLLLIVGLALAAFSRKQPA